MLFVEKTNKLVYNNKYERRDNMSRVIYLDYSATTPVNEEVLNDFIEDNKIIGNANSIHLLGRKCKDEINKASNDILKLLGLSEDEYEVIYTSGSTEANNLAIKGLLAKKSNGHIITTSLEHSSVVAPLSTLQRKGFSVEFAKNNENGLIDLLELEKSITDETVLVSIAAVSSEIGILQPIEEINQLINRKKRDNPNLIFHIDATQAIGKTKIKLDGIDMISFSGHKIYGLKGIGALIKKKEVSIYGEIQGGKSTTKYRSGTPCHPLIMSLRNSLKIALTNLQLEGFASRRGISPLKILHFCCKIDWCVCCIKYGLKCRLEGRGIALRGRRRVQWAGEIMHISECTTGTGCIVCGSRNNAEIANQRDSNEKNGCDDWNNILF